MQRIDGPYSYYNNEAIRELAKRKEGIINSIKDSCESEEAAWLVLYERPKRIIIEIRFKDLESTKKE